MAQAVRQRHWRQSWALGRKGCGRGPCLKQGGLEALVRSSVPISLLSTLAPALRHTRVAAPLKAHMGLASWGGPECGTVWPMESDGGLVFVAATLSLDGHQASCLPIPEYCLHSPHADYCLHSPCPDGRRRAGERGSTALPFPRPRHVQSTFTLEKRQRGAPFPALQIEFQRG